MNGKETWCRTGDPGSEGAPGDVILVVLDDDAVISWQGGQVADAARPVLVVHAVDLGFGGTLDGQVQTAFEKGQTQSACIFCSRSGQGAVL